MLSDSLLAIANLLLPEVLVTYFDLTKHEIKGEELHFYFTELNKVPDGYSGAKLHSKGFFPAVSYTHLRAHETKANLVCRLLLEKKKKKKNKKLRRNNQEQNQKIKTKIQYTR